MQENGSGVPFSYNVRDSNEDDLETIILHDALQNANLQLEIAQKDKRNIYGALQMTGENDDELDALQLYVLPHE